MGREIERKFRVAGDGWRQGEGVLFRQGYLCTDQDRTVRVRLEGERGVITIKGRTEGLSRAEFEYEVPASEAEEMLEKLCLHPLIEKRRRRIDHAGRIWEVDEFSGENEGLVVAEVELDEEDEAIDLPPWVGEEVSDDPRYYNANLVKHPYGTWGLG
ncbi:CYTH domain-containing protein [Haloferula sargassicola]|uniref:Inorganic triphosphatase n=1 Tax=Haloferula sargassicola TaxID=490096 RepID=A0ABP9UT31_9BACT